MLMATLWAELGGGTYDWQMMLCQAYWKAPKEGAADKEMSLAGHSIRTRLLPYAHVRVQRVQRVHAAAEGRRLLALLQRG